LQNDSSIEDIKKYHTISIFSPNINFEQKEKIKELYSDKNILFNTLSKSDLYVIISNHYEPKNSLDDVLLQIKNSNRNFNLLIYMDINKFIQISFNLIKIVEKKFNNIDGSGKKAEFLTLLKQTIGDDNYSKNEIYIDFVLETCIYLSKTHMISGLNKDSFKCF
jgi:hypothetical protein